MAKEKEKTAKNDAQETKSSALEPCEKPHTMETSRPDNGEDACDEGVK